MPRPPISFGEQVRGQDTLQFPPAADAVPVQRNAVAGLMMSSVVCLVVGLAAGPTLYFFSSFSDFRGQHASTIAD